MAAGGTSASWHLRLTRASPRRRLPARTLVAPAPTPLDPHSTMASLIPFRALRPLPAHVEEAACPPYDVISTAEARALAEGLDGSFLHVVRPEVALPVGTDEHDDAVYDAGAKALARFADSDAWVEDATPGLWVYRLIMDGRPQVGVFGCVSVSDYDDDVILKHEKTRVDKEDDRTRHILTQRAHAEPVMLTCRDDDEVDAVLAESMAGEPVYDFESRDTRHTFWRVTDVDRLVTALGAIERLYVADGHHRCKAASRTAAELGGEGEHRAFPAVIFPMSNMNLMAYNRVVRDFADGAEAAFAAVAERLEPVGDGPNPASPGEVSVYSAKTGWRRFRLPETTRQGVADRLDVARLAEHVLEPVFGITDPRTDERIYFVGGIRGTGTLSERVDAGAWQLAFSMYPTAITDLVDVSDAGELMPPKSTWFEPKLISGVLVHRF